MKNFNELTKRELADLNETQVEAYIDIELSNQGVKKNIIFNFDYPDFIKPTTEAPEKDLTLYEVDSYNFLDMETAQKFSDFIGKLYQVDTTYDYNVGSEYIYAREPKLQTPSVQIKKTYSEIKFIAIKEQLNQLNKAKKEASRNEKNIEDSAVDYEEIDKIKYQIRGIVRNAVDFFVKSKEYSKEFEKYLSITNDEEIALKTLFTVYNIQDEEMKTQISIEIKKKESV